MTASKPSKEFKEKCDFEELRHKLRMEELEYQRENENLHHEHEMTRQRIKSAEIQKTLARKQAGRDFERFAPKHHE